MASKFLKNKDEICIRIIEDNSSEVIFTIFENSIESTKAQDKDKLMASFSEISESEYKSRVVAAAMFQDFRKDPEYEHKTYLPQYEENQRAMTELEVERNFILSGGYVKIEEGK